MVRSSFTNIYIFSSGDCDISNLEGTLQTLNGKYEKPSSLAQQILNVLVDLKDISPQDDSEHEAKTADEYDSNFGTIKITVQNKLTSTLN